MKAATSDTTDQVMQAMFRAALGAWGGGESPLDAMPNTLEFVKRYSLQMERRPFDFDSYSHHVDIYEDVSLAITLMCGAQVGKSAWLMALLLRAGVLKWGAHLGYYFPDYHLPRVFSRQRFRPFVMSNPELGPWLGAGGKHGDGADAVLIRTFGPTVFHFLSVAGKTSTEGIPMAGVFFDEVRNMSHGDIQRAEERTSAQRNPVNIKVSTAKYPESDIHRYFLAGDQRWFHTDCRCPDGTILAQTWPNCIADLTRATPELRRKAEHAFLRAGIPYLGLVGEERGMYPEAAYVCPKCGEFLPNPRAGWWEAHAPGKRVHSYQMPQMLTPAWPAPKMWDAWVNPTAPLDIMEWYNSKCGIPYLDAESVLVKPEHLESCINPDAKWAARQTDRWRKKYCVNTCMGVDAQAGYNVCVIKQRLPNGKYRTIHLEIVHGDDPWLGTAKLMHRFDVAVCVADCMPHWNEAMRFAKAFPGRVFLAIYTRTEGSDGKGPVIAWKDRPAGNADEKGKDDGFKFMVHLDRARALKWSLSRWGQRANEVPPPDELLQTLPRQGGKVLLSSGLHLGVMEPTAICREVYFPHQQLIVFRKEWANDDAAKVGNFKIRAEWIREDPHFAHANLYADAACSRVGEAPDPRML
jgi:hypothetical protein